MLDDGCPGAADGERVAHDAVRLDQVLLDHHQRFGLGHHVAVVPRDFQRAGHGGEAFPQHLSHEHARRCALLIADAAVGPPQQEQLVVPCRLGIGKVPALFRIEQDGNLVLSPVARTGLQPHDERNRDALVRRGLRDGLGWRRIGRVVGLEIRVGSARDGDA